MDCYLPLPHSKLLWFTPFTPLGASIIPQLPSQSRQRVDSDLAMSVPKALPREGAFFAFALSEVFKS